jgi:cardiolipin synthase
MSVQTIAPRPLQMNPGNRASLLVGDDATYQAALNLINGAKSNIQFETFTFNGAQGQGITNALIAAAKRGVRVQVVLDTKAMLVGTQGALAKQLVAGGVDVRQYQERSLNNPLVAIDHAKIIAVDGAAVLVGGTNFDRRDNYDLNYEIQGPAVSKVQDQFVQSWDKSRLNTDNGSRGVDWAAVPVTPPSGPLVGGDTSVGISETAPKNDSSASSKTSNDAVSAIQNAKSSVDLLLYNLDDPKEIQALIAAKNRGVNVRVILNHETGHTFLAKLKCQLLNLNMNAVKQLKTAGIPVQWFTLAPGIDEMHAKVAIFDGSTVLGGSTNWVTSSNQDNHELGVWLNGPIAGQVEGVYNNLWQSQSTPVPKLSLYQNFNAFIGGLLAHFI